MGHTVRILGPNNRLMAEFEMGDDDGMSVEVDGREYVGLLAPDGDKGVRVVVWTDEDGEENMTFTPPGVPTPDGKGFPYNE